MGTEEIEEVGRYCTTIYPFCHVGNFFALYILQYFLSYQTVHATLLNWWHWISVFDISNISPIFPLHFLWLILCNSDLLRLWQLTHWVYNIVFEKKLKFWKWSNMNARFVTSLRHFSPNVRGKITLYWNILLRERVSSCGAAPSAIISFGVIPKNETSMFTNTKDVFSLLQWNWIFKLDKLKINWIFLDLG